MIHEEEYIKHAIQQVVSWHLARNLVHGSTDKDQVLKLIQEVGELSDSICKEQSPIDDIGDIMVVLINIALRNNLSLTDCLNHAYNDIKDRKGQMVDGIFVKESDLIDADSLGNK
tara:strand:- start:487 stop:831 length:345 start_codon:yes stop_codon:yes gene_type:complete